MGLKKAKEKVDGEVEEKGEEVEEKGVEVEEKGEEEVGEELERMLIDLFPLLFCFYFFKCLLIFFLFFFEFWSLIFYIFLL